MPAGLRRVDDVAEVETRAQFHVACRSLSGVVSGNYRNVELPSASDDHVFAKGLHGGGCAGVDRSIETVPQWVCP